MKRNLLITVLALFLILGFSSTGTASFLRVFISDDLGLETSYEPSADYIFTKTVAPGDTFDLGLYVWVDNAALKVALEDSTDYLYVPWARMEETTAIPVLTFAEVSPDDGNLAEWGISTPWGGSNWMGSATEELLAGEPDGTYRLATAHLTALMETGIATLITDLLWHDPLTPEFESYNYIDLEDVVNFRPGTVTVVPIPGAAFLFGSGLIGLIGLGRKKIRG